MLTFAYYLLKVMLCSGILFGYYWLALRNKKFHRYNRFYLLASVVLSWLIPLIKIDLFKEANQQTEIVKLLTAVASGDQFVEEVASQSAFNWDWQLLLVSAFIAVSALFFIKILVTVVRITRLVRSHPVQKWKQIYFVFTNAKGTPFSFFKYIFWNEEIDLKSPEGEHILKHELVHVQEKHSTDKMFMNLVLIGGWYNPVMWLVCKELNILHEFIADEKAIKDGDAADFAAMLLKAAYPQYSLPLVNSFFYSPIKRRLLMLTSSKKTSYSYLRRVAVLPLLSVTFVLFAFSLKKKQTYASPAATFKSVIAPGTEQTVESANEADENFEDTTKNKKKERNLTGSTDNSIKKVHLTLKDSTGNKFEIEADTILISKDKKGLNKELIIVDGDVRSYNQLNTINPSIIQSMNVLKGESAIKIYGERGKYGVIEITTKQIAQQQTQPEEQKYERLFTRVENPPYYSKGMTGFADYINSNVQYPKEAIQNKIEGAVLIQFIVSDEGKLSGFKQLSAKGYGLEEEAIRLIKDSGEWKPGVQNGHKVPVQIEQQIIFQLPKI